MVRVTNGFQRHKRHKKFRKMAKGFRLGRRTVYKQIRWNLVRQGQNAYIWRKEKKREFRKLWIERLSASIREKGGKYSLFIWKMNKKSIILNRKVLSNIALAFPDVFTKIYNEVVK